MSLTISTQPSTSIMQSAYRPIRYVVTSDAGTISKVQCEVYIAGVLAKTVVHDPDINTTNQFTFDISGYVRDNLTLYPPYSNSIIQILAGSSLISTYVHCVFNEVLLTAGALAVQSTDYTSNTSYASNAILQHEDTQSFTNYYQDNTSKLFATNMPDGSSVKRGETIGVPFFFSTVNEGIGKIFQYNGSSLITTNSQATSSGFDDYKLGWWMINTSYLDTSCDRIVIQLFENTGTTPYSSQRTYYIKSAGCEDDKRIWFMNQFGGFEAFTFDGEFIEGLSVSAKEYKKILAYNFNVRDRGMDTFRVDALEKFKTSTRPLNREEYRWLRELKTSPKLYVQEGSNMIPIIQLNRESYKIEGNNIGLPMELEYIKANDLLIQ